ncbi:MAG TPA: rod shape-determining protein RodA [Bacteroidales bacterium]|nr:rod shape-determining protein RodA [Bacteroidales bacterium]
MSKQVVFFKNIDKPLLLLFLVLVAFGWMNIFSTGFREGQTVLFDLSKDYGKQLIFIFAALIIGASVLLMDAKFFTAFAWVIFGVSMLTLLGVLVFGVEINASRSWFRVGQFNLQPSEFSKYATALAMAAFFSNVKSRQISAASRLRAIAIILIPMGLILLQNDLGTAIVFSAFVIVMFREGYLSGILIVFGLLAVFLFIMTLIINPLIIIGAIAVIIVAIIALNRQKIKEIGQLILLFLVFSFYVYSVNYVYDNVLQPHQKLRIEVLLNNEIDLQGAGYNLNQSKIAIGSGGFFGQGFLQGTQTKFQFVPEQSTDFIFSTVGEEWGFAGSVVFLILYLALLSRLVILAERQRSTFSRVFGYSVASIMFFHFFINVGMTIGLMPVIGIPLPLISYGGSSLWAFTLMVFTFLKLDSKRLELL